MTISTHAQAIDIDRATDTRYVFRDLLLRQRPRALVLAIASLVFLASILLHLQVILSTTGASFDMLSYRIQADTVFRHVNVYTATGRYPYPPVWIWVIALVRWVSDTLGARFDAVAKIPATIGDLATGVVLLLYSYRRFGWSWLTLIPMALYALNPVALLIGAGHGQFDSLVIFFVLLAIYFRGARQDEHIVWGALALGVAIALKGYPALVLPYFVVSAPRGSRPLTAVVAFVPLVVSVIIYCGLFGFTTAMVTDVLRYRSQPDFGWGLMLGPRVSKGISSQLTLLSQMVIVLFAVTVPALLFRTRPACAMVALFAAFYVLTYNMAVQYIVWILPFLCLAFPIWSVVYTLASLFGIATFYHLYYPGAIPSAAPWHGRLTLFEIGWRHGAAIVIGASALLLLYVLLYGLCTATSVFASLRAPLPSWIRRRLASLQEANVDALLANVAARANVEDSAA